MSWDCPQDPGIAAPLGRRRPSVGLLSHLLIATGSLLILAGALYAAATVLVPWLASQNRAGALTEIAPPVTPEPAPAVPGSSAISMRTAVAAAEPAEPAHSTPAPGQSPPRVPGPPSATATPAPTPAPTSTPLPVAPVRIRIAALGVDRTIVPVPLAYDSRTRSFVRDLNILFRSRGKDLVGHWGGSASPGQPGNMILVGHNYGYGVRAVFVALPSMKPGQAVEVTDAAGQVHVYRVTSVNSVPWRKKSVAEAARHQAFLQVDGPERLTLVTCGGATWEPFPLRIYVVAEPVP